MRVVGNADSRRIVPVTDYDDEPPDDVYAIRHPDGIFRLMLLRLISSAAVRALSRL